VEQLLARFHRNPLGGVETHAQEVVHRRRPAQLPPELRGKAPFESLGRRAVNGHLVFFILVLLDVLEHNEKLALRGCPLFDPNRKRLAVALANPDKVGRLDPIKTFNGGGTIAELRALRG